MTVALPAVLELANDVVPPRLAVIVALPAVLALLKVVKPPKLAVRVALPAVLEPRKLANPPPALVMFELPAVLVSSKLANPLFVLVMVALPAVLELLNCVTAAMPLLLMIALPAVLLLANVKREFVGTTKLGAFEELLTMPMLDASLRKLRPAAETLQVAVEVFDIQGSGGLEAALLQLAETHPDAVLVAPDLLLLTRRKEIA